jgi:hypothetical protein
MSTIINETKKQKRTLIDILEEGDYIKGTICGVKCLIIEDRIIPGATWGYVHYELAEPADEFLKSHFNVTKYGSCDDPNYYCTIIADHYIPADRDDLDQFQIDIGDLLNKQGDPYAFA